MTLKASVYAMPNLNSFFHLVNGLILTIFTTVLLIQSVALFVVSRDAYCALVNSDYGIQGLPVSFCIYLSKILKKAKYI